MTEDYERSYFEVWGEMPPAGEEGVTEDDQYEPAPEAATAAAASPGAPPRRVGSQSAPQPPAADELDRKANEVIQRMMVDTLRRVHSRLAIMDEHQADSQATVPSAVRDLCDQLSRLADEIARFLQRTRRINEELAGIQIESAKNLALIAKKVKELESRPLHWPPR